MSETISVFHPRKEADKIAPLWPAYVKAHSGEPHESRFADFIVLHAKKHRWTMRQAFLVDYHFQEALDAYWKRDEE